MCKDEFLEVTKNAPNLAVCVLLCCSERGLACVPCPELPSADCVVEICQGINVWEEVTAYPGLGGQGEPWTLPHCAQDQNLNLYLALQDWVSLWPSCLSRCPLCFLPKVASEVKYSFEHPLLLLHRRAIEHALSLSQTFFILHLL